MQVPIINGIYTDEASDFRTSYPKNFVPVPKSQGISQGYLRPGDGIVELGTGPGVPRGGINWNDKCFRVMGTKLVLQNLNGTVTTIGDVGAGGQASLDYSFDYLGVVSNNSFYLYDNATLQQVTDPDLGSVIDHIWVDGYFMLTDGEFLIVTDLSDPFSINPVKYGSSEADPDPIKALIKVRNEPHALNRYTIEVFDNIGASGFPFQRIEGAQVQKGVVGTHMCCLFADAIAFVGGGRNESIAVHIAGGGNSVKISTREIDQQLSKYTESILSQCTVEARVDKGHQHLYIHLPDRTLVYDAAASQVVGQPVWFILCSAIDGFNRYRAKDFVWCYNEWLVADPLSDKVGKISNTVASHWGEEIGWEFSTTIIYNEGNGAIFHELELVALTGRVAINDDPTIWTQYSVDGETFSMLKGIKSGKQGNRKKRLVWLNQGSMRNWRLQKFKGTSESMLSVARLEIRLEQLMV